MSHELRTPLNAIIGFSELIRDDPAAQAKGAAFGDYAQEIHDSGSQLFFQIINDLLDLTEIDAGNHTIHPEPLEVARLLDTCARLLAGTARERKLRLTVEVEPGCPSLIADARAVRQIILNLLSNALKFTPEGGWVTLNGGVSAHGVALTISDNGIGIDPGRCRPCLRTLLAGRTGPVTPLWWYRPWDAAGPGLGRTAQGELEDR